MEACGGRPPDDSHRQELARIGGRSDAVFDAEELVNVAEMLLHRSDREAENERDFVARFAGADPVQDGEFVVA